jgi:hypothetical protein
LRQVSFDITGRQIVHDPRQINQTSTGAPRILGASRYGRLSQISNSTRHRRAFGAGQRNQPKSFDRVQQGPGRDQHPHCREPPICCSIVRFLWLQNASTPDASPFVAVPRPDVKEARWAEPQLVAEVEFTAWTRDDRVRHPIFKGLREDKPAKAVRRETAKARVWAASIAHVAVRRYGIVAAGASTWSPQRRRGWRGVGTNPCKVIAYELGLAEATVKVHIRHIMKKLNARNRTQVVLMTRDT